jgi:hypothetical protein
MSYATSKLLGRCKLVRQDRSHAWGKYPVIHTLNATMIPVHKIQIHKCLKISQKYMLVFTRCMFTIPQILRTKFKIDTEKQKKEI